MILNGVFSPLAGNSSHPYSQLSSLVCNISRVFTIFVSHFSNNLFSIILFTSHVLLKGLSPLLIDSDRLLHLYLISSIILFVFLSVQLTFSILLYQHTPKRVTSPYIPWWLTSIYCYPSLSRRTSSYILFYFQFNISWNYHSSLLLYTKNKSWKHDDLIFLIVNNISRCKIVFSYKKNGIP